MLLARRNHGPLISCGAAREGPDGGHRRRVLSSSVFSTSADVVWSDLLISRCSSVSKGRRNVARMATHPDPDPGSRDSPLPATEGGLAGAGTITLPCPIVDAGVRGSERKVRLLKVAMSWRRVDVHGSQGDSKPPWGFLGPEEGADHRSQPPWKKLPALVIIFATWSLRIPANRVISWQPQKRGKADASVAFLAPPDHG